MPATKLVVNFDWKTKMKRIVFAVLLAVISMPAFAAKLPKVDICHFDLDYGVWKLISISENAIEKHFENHDDGLPGEATLGTGAQLDEACALKTTLTCPCWNGYAEDELVAALAPALSVGEYVDATDCVQTGARYFAMVHLKGGPKPRVFNLGAATANDWQCNLQLNFGGPPIHMDGLGATVGGNCFTEASDVVPRLPGCL